MGTAEFARRRSGIRWSGCGASITPTEAAREDIVGSAKSESHLILAGQQKDTTVRTARRDRSVMKAPSRFSRVVSLVAAVGFASVAVAQPPSGGPGDPFGVGLEGPGPGPGPRGSVLDFVASSLPHPAYHHRHCRSSGNAADSSVTWVQSALRKRGYYSGAIDGDARRGTRAAVRGFREDNSLGSSTGIDGTLLRVLGL